MIANRHRRQKRHTAPQSYQQQTRTTDYNDIDGSPGVMDWIINATVHVITFIPVTLAKFLNAFVERGGVGIQALGAVAFLGGVVAGADNYYQGFTGKALLPWFIRADWVGDLAATNAPQPLIEIFGESVIGWTAVFFSIFSIGFLIALVFSLLTQFIQGQSVRGRSVQMAQEEFAKWNAPTMPSAPNPETSLDMATVSWKELKRTGKRQKGFIGFIAIALWVSEFIAAFTAHNPLNYIGQAGLFLGCTIYALATVVAGELGYAIYCAAKEESQS
ncbi:MAG: hypothetical protein AAGB19_02780 [Cyanobacteria bacterium P01_F01_bin.3]